MAKLKEKFIKKKQNNINNNEENKTESFNHQVQQQVVGGIRFKHFEHVVASILLTVEPKYISLPALPMIQDCNEDDNIVWPFSLLPCSARVWGTQVGQLQNMKNGLQKEGQIRSM
jgi:hypothetical protein